jgi:hypothetical protein
MRNEEGGVTASSGGFRRDLRTKVEDDLALTGGTHTSAKEKVTGCTGSGNTSWAAGLVLLLGRRVPRGPFLFSFVSFLFSLWISYFFNNFCIFGSNCFKPTS